MASCSFDNHGQILTIFVRRHQHTFKNDMLIQLLLSVHFLHARRLAERSTCYVGNMAGWLAGCMSHAGIVYKQLNQP